LAVSSGNASFEIPAGLLLNAGLSVLTITTLTNVATTCSVPVQNNVSDSFTIHAIPDMPTVNDMDFCQADNATVANLLPHGNSYKWYASATDNVPLADTMILASGNYFVAAINPSTGCASSKAMVTITINAIPAPVLDQDGQIFCGLDNPTLQDLTANSHAAGTIIWYDALTDGNLLPDTQALGQGITYYGFDFSDVFNCQSEEALAVTVTLTDCDPAQYEFFIPDGFSPNGDSVNDTFRIPDIEFLYPGFTLEIYNRYGNLLFKGNKSRPYWDGKNTQSGSITDGIVPNGVYFYIVDFNKGNKPPQQGRLYLNR
jgi:gliding motility-associated-like protein